MMIQKKKYFQELTLNDSPFAISLRLSKKLSIFSDWAERIGQTWNSFVSEMLGGTCFYQRLSPQTDVQRTSNINISRIS